MNDLTATEVLALLANECVKAGSVALWCEEPGRPSATYVQGVLYRGIPLGPKILRALGLEKIVTYRKLHDNKERP
jgi:hypothetical protein